MFVKRKEKQTLAENFVEAIKVEKDLEAIYNHLGNEESEGSISKKNGKKNKEIESDGKDRVILQLQNEIMNLKRSKGDGKKPFKKITNTNTSPQVPPTLGINLEDYAMDNFYYTHYANHSEKTCPEYITSFKEILLPHESLRKDEQEADDEEEKEEVEEEDGVEHSSNMHLI